VRVRVREVKEVKKKKVRVKVNVKNTHPSTTSKTTQSHQVKPSGPQWVAS
jgi:hypothetical protein